MDLATTNAEITNEQTGPHDLFALSDEQILEIAPEHEVTGRAHEEGSMATASQTPNALAHTAPSSANHESPVTSHDVAQPPALLAAHMQAAWRGEEATAFSDRLHSTGAVAP